MALQEVQEKTDMKVSVVNAPGTKNLPAERAVGQRNQRPEWDHGKDDRAGDFEGRAVPAEIGAKKGPARQGQ
jgi:hypothetical protein